MLVTALTGDVGAGKSTLSRVWRDMGANVVDADEVTLKLLRDGEIRGLHVQWPQAQAYTCLFTLFRALTGEELPEITWEPAEYAMSYATRDDAPWILDLLYPGHK